MIKPTTNTKSKSSTTNTKSKSKSKKGNHYNDVLEAVTKRLPKLKSPIDPSYSCGKDVQDLYFYDQTAYASALFARSAFDAQYLLDLDPINGVNGNMNPLSIRELVAKRSLNELEQSYNTVVNEDIPNGIQNTIKNAENTVSTTINKADRSIRESIKESFTKGLGTIIENGHSAWMSTLDPKEMNTQQIRRLKKTIPSKSIISLLSSTGTGTGCYVPSELSVINNTSMREMKRQSSISRRKLAYAYASEEDPEELLPRQSSTLSLSLSRRQQFLKLSTSTRTNNDYDYNEEDDYNEVDEDEGSDDEDYDEDDDERETCR